VKKQKVALPIDDEDEDVGFVESSKDESSDTDICERCYHTREDHTPPCHCGCSKFRAEPSE
jgi:hypothetical protein